VSKRVSNKPSRTGARTFRTHRVYRARLSARAKRAAENQAEILRERAKRFNAQRTEPAPRQSLQSRVATFVRRVFKGGRP
jgi:hypothetical protein